MRSRAEATAPSTGRRPSSPPGSRRKVLWCVTRPDLFAPALSEAGLKSDRVIYLEGHQRRGAFVQRIRRDGARKQISPFNQLNNAFSEIAKCCDLDEAAPKLHKSIFVPQMS